MIRPGPEPLRPTPPPSALEQFASASLWIVDLDGVLWLAGEPIGDIAGAVSALRHRGARVVFATNNSAPTSAELVARLERVGVAAGPEDLATSASAVASMLQPGDTVKVLAEGGVVEALGHRGVAMVESGPVDAAVVGWSRSFDFDILAAVATAARTSGRLIATNQDPTHPTPTGLLPGSGALVAAVATASGVTPEVAGKPNPPMAAMLKHRFGFTDGDPSVVLVGDQPDTDGRLAQVLGIPFALVDSGVTPPGAAVDDVPVALRLADFVTLVGTSLGHA
jgi:glycerol-1-phosphatase